MTSPPLTYTAQIFIIIVANISGNLVFEIHGINFKKSYSIIVKQLYTSELRAYSTELMGAN